MENWTINGHILEYDDANHTYLVDGVIVPSVTQLIGLKFGNKYNHVRADVLECAANRGTIIHKQIERYCKGEEVETIKELHNFKFLMNYYNLKVVDNEIPIILSYNYKPVAAGRLDLVLEDRLDLCLADIKTTSTLDKNYLAYQLNLYRLGYMQSYGKDIKKLFGVHLKENTRKLVGIPIVEEIVKELLEEYTKGAKYE